MTSYGKIVFLKESVEESLEKRLEQLQISRQKIKKFIKKKQRDKIIPTNYVTSVEINCLNDLIINPEYSGAKIKIEYEDCDWLIFNKPPRIHSQPHCYEDQNNVLSFLRSIGRGNLLNQVRTDFYDRGLCFRLDYETSGILIYAKNISAWNLRDKVKKKIYFAITDVHGPKIGHYTHKLGAYGPKGSQVREHHEGQDCSLEIIESYPMNNSRQLLVINLETGFRHQIRVQLKSLGFPIIGDELYGGKREDRLGLHAWQYHINEKKFEASPDAFFDHFSIERNLLDLDC